MKNFDDFRAYMRSDGAAVHDIISERVEAAVASQSFASAADEYRFRQQAWVELGFVEMLEHYHNWLNA